MRSNETRTLYEAAKLLGLSFRTIERWAWRNGAPIADDSQGKPSALRWPAFPQWYKREVLRGEIEELASASPRYRLAIAESELRELKLFERKRTLVPLALFEAHFKQTCGEFAAMTRRQLTRYEREIVRAETAADARKVTDQLRDALLSGSRDYAAKLRTRSDARVEEDDVPTGAEH